MCSGPDGEEGLCAQGLETGAVCSGPEGEDGLCAQGLKVRRGCVLRA